MRLGALRGKKCVGANIPANAFGQTLGNALAAQTTPQQPARTLANFGDETSNLRLRSPNEYRPFDFNLASAGQFDLSYRNAPNDTTSVDSANLQPQGDYYSDADIRASGLKGSAVGVQSTSSPTTNAYVGGADFGIGTAIGGAPTVNELVDKYNDNIVNQASARGLPLAPTKFNSFVLGLISSSELDYAGSTGNLSQKIQTALGLPNDGPDPNGAQILFDGEVYKDIGIGAIKGTAQGTTGFAADVFKALAEGAILEDRRMMGIAGTVTGINNLAAESGLSVPQLAKEGTNNFPTGRFFTYDANPALGGNFQQLGGALGEFVSPFVLGKTLQYGSSLAALGIRYVSSTRSTFASEFAGGVSDINKVGFGVNTRRYAYEPNGQVILQSLPDSCVAGACRMKISDIGLDVPEAYLRSDLAYVAGEGTSFRNIPNALAIPENGGLVGTFSRDTLRLSALRNSVNTSGSAIVNINGHAVLVDRIANGLVNIRDPLNGAYSVSARDFLRAFAANNRIAITFGK